MSKLPKKLIRGSKWEEQSASEWNRLIDEVRQLRGELESFRGTRSSIKPQQFFNVLILEEPEEDAKVIKVRRVISAPDGAGVRKPRFDGPSRFAHPDFPSSVSDFRGKAWNGELPLSESASFIPARSERGEWYLVRQAEGGGTNPASGPRIAQFEITDGASFSDYVMGKRIDIPDSQPIPIGKPWYLRRTPFDGETVGPFRYTYQSNIQRLSRNLDNQHEETQKITPPYRESYLIQAATNIEGSGTLQVPGISSEQLTNRFFSSGATGWVGFETPPSNRWTLGTSGSVTAAIHGQSGASGSTDHLSQLITIAPNQPYTVNVNIAQTVSPRPPGRIRFAVGNVLTQSIAIDSGVNSYTFSVTSDSFGGDRFSMIADSDWRAAVRSVSLTTAQTTVVSWFDINVDGRMWAV